MTHWIGAMIVVVTLACPYVAAHDMDRAVWRVVMVWGGWLLCLPLALGLMLLFGDMP